jgi:hypothetical protein
VIFTYGNNDAGLLSLHHALHKALIIDTAMLRRFTLSECLKSLFADHKPNQWGARKYYRIPHAVSEWYRFSCKKSASKLRTANFRSTSPRCGETD